MLRTANFGYQIQWLTQTPDWGYIGFIGIDGKANGYYYSGLYRDYRVFVGVFRSNVDP